MAKMDAETKSYLKGVASRLVYLSNLYPGLLDIAQRLDDQTKAQSKQSLSLEQLQTAYDRLNGD